MSHASSPALRSGAPLSVLLLCDEWSSHRGGISTVNRALAAALAAEGHRVVCLVESATREEHLDAAECGVELVVAQRTPAGPNLFLPDPAVERLRPDVVIGHDRVTGEAAWAHARKHGDAWLVHVVHTAPSEVERYKDSGRATGRIEERERFTRLMAREADVLAAVGPLLTRHTESVVHDGEHDVRVVRLDPGLDADGAARTPPARPLVLVLGRTEEPLVKGLDIAAGAVADLDVRPGAPAPTLLVRGAPEPLCDRVHADLVKGTGLAASRLDVRPFAAGNGEARRDLLRAAVCVMPSRAEGFGLSALEAIGVGTPVLVSARSGLAELLFEVLGPGAAPMVVEVTDGPRDRAVWSEAIRRVLEDLPGAFAHAEDVRRLLASRLGWRAAAVALLGAPVRR
ncbi:glycosyltransferase family 4 protein [Saccharothrix longispora]|uniref:glycosyltransferase family 4 protein n=1 Tax=Saccharothrix longispora TaxID=33920 RepID=UPI0028FDAE3E|nr:glycosyltransferase family 4 protein [Saccharothrix longispora]MBY8851379.1 glycosyltransferase family 4 protein [Saccharothrix sp. MB29]MDU0293964.1 glycosyltransferase family 4 protein [Saccharothrix longispora]